MQVTTVFLRKNKRESGLKFFANVLFDNVMWVSGFKVFKRKTTGELFVMPPMLPDASGKKNEKGYPKEWNVLYFKKDGEVFTEEAEQLKQEISDSIIEAAHNYTNDTDTERPWM